MLRLSPGESERLAREEQAAQRIARLKQVRGQARQIAIRKRGDYTASAEAEWARAERGVKDTFDAAKDAAIAAVLASMDKNAPMFGRAQAQAQCLVEAREEDDKHLADFLLKNQTAELNRGRVALHEFRAEKDAAEFNQKQHLSNLLTLRTTTTAREKHMAQLFRAHQAKLSPDVCPLSQPLDLQNRLHREGSHRKGHLKYDYTQHHRNFAVVRLDPGVENRVVVVDAAEAAPFAASRTHGRLNRAEDRAKLDRVAAEERFHAAVTVKTMDTKRDALCNELERLKVEDRARKCGNTGGGPAGLKTRREGFVKVGEAAMKERFSKVFGIGDDDLAGGAGGDGAGSLENAKTREFLRREYGLGRIDNESVADSIEFSRANSPLQLNTVGRR
ncbi:hypothetical protein HDU98_000138 [Podochytrium sp. JEL0797]|nr:hypothetical protein HDU98_000138 [Podochytrium sp. JEL0797]